MDDTMICNRWLFRPHANGPIHLRLTYRDAAGKRVSFDRSLNTSDWVRARRIRDTEFVPIFYDIEKARAQLDLILERFPELEQRLSQGLHGGYGSRGGTEPAGVLLGAVLGKWQKALTAKGGTYAPSERTASRYSTIGSTFVAFMGNDTDIATIASADVARYRDSRLAEHQKSKKTVKLELTAVRSLFHFAAEQGHIRENPVKGVVVKSTRAEKKRDEREGRRRPPTEAEADRICTSFPLDHHAKFKAEDLQDYALVARYTGMRQGEIAHIRASDVVLLPSDQYVDAVMADRRSHAKPYTGTVPSGSVLCIWVSDEEGRRTKTGLERVVPVAGKLLPVLERRLESARGRELFPFAVDDSGASFGRLWLKKVKKIDATLTMHGFRAYATSQMENAGVNPGVARLILGHEQADVHEGYFHKQISTLKQAVDRIH